jgi:phosphoribosylformimino-5-aminoimidazole carboxamide ribotide isomerase
MIEIIPAIDIIDGKCVRLEKGNYNSKKIYSSDPLEVARMFESWGVKRLHLVDLDGAKAHRILNYKVLANISLKTSLIIDFGGGIKSDEDIQIAFDNGASMVTCGSIAVKEPEKVMKWIQQYGLHRLILGADHRKGKVAVGGWLEESEMDLNDLIASYYSHGLRKVISTDIDKDGMLQGPSMDSYKELLKSFKEIYLIASGGVSGIEDVEKLNDAGVHGVIIGKAIYENYISEYDLKKFL